ncbi:hemerythrin domain-containing protein [Nocardioides daphniae]|uniref:hemerythrin domain-containing protein n=1 Tax=Nocardioides daphniae TaxID=402297 RepID=UPI001EE87363|nr:hemerythrin domain-containing protein [Nocardioides daphniae]
MKDHREFERMLAQMESDPTSRATVLPVFATLLTAHSRAEENEVYPAASAADGADDVAHSQEEHVEADRLVERLQACDPDSAEFAELLAEVAEAVTHPSRRRRRRSCRTCVSGSTTTASRNWARRS